MTDPRPAILELLHARRPGATICPSEAARHLDPGHWRTRMEAVREAAREMALRGDLEICQKGVVIDPNLLRGPVRFRLPLPPS